MTKRILFLAVCGALLLPGAVHAAAGLHGRSARTQAAFDAALWDAPAHVQVLTSVCSRPSKLRGCTPMSARMRAALEGALGVSITWVDQRRVHGPVFVVYAPVAFDGATATAEMAYWEPGANGCTGGARTAFERQQGVWRWSTMLGWAACSARS